MPDTPSISRRQFIAAVSSAAAVSPSITRAAANDRIKVAFIGVGGRGARNLKTLTDTGQVDVFAICDVDSRYLDGVGEKYPGAERFRDFRRLFDKVGNGIDAAVVSTTEHTHAYATMPALQLGKHVYCEKPLAYSVYETRRIAEAAADAGVATQMGTQIHASDNFRQVVELIRSGAIGDVAEVDVWVGRAWGLQSQADAEEHKDRIYVEKRPAESMTPPPSLDWDLWLGPAPWRPYHRVYFPGPNWYRWWDFGGGTMSDLGSHWNDLPFWALRLGRPESIQAFGPPPHQEIAPASMSAVYHYGRRGSLPEVKLTWHQGTSKPQAWLQRQVPQWNSGVLFHGSKGLLLSDYKKHVLLPEDDFRDFRPPEPFVGRSIGHHEEWLAACRGESDTGSPFATYAGHLTEANHLGNVAYRVGKKIRWDRDAMKCVGCPEADPIIRREPREGWSL